MIRAFLSRLRNPRGYGAAAPVGKADNPVFSSEPVNDYWGALWRLVAHFEQTGEYYDDGPLPWAVTFVADLFWLHPEQVRRDLVRCRRSMP